MRFFSLLAALLTASAAAQPVAVPGTRASLLPPEGYVASERFAGFESDSLGGTLMVLDIPGAPLAEITAAFTPEALAAQGVMDAEVTEATLDGRAATWVRGQQSAYGETYHKWLLVTGDSLGAVMLNAVLTVEASGEDVDAMETALLSLTLGEAPEDLFDGLPFTLTVPESLPERQRLGATLLLAQSYGEAQPPGAPLYIAGLGAAPLGDDLDAAARRRLRQTTSLYMFGDIETRPLAVGGREGVEAIAMANDVDSNADVMTILVLVPHTETGYLIVQATVGLEAWDEWQPQFRAITESLAWRE